MPMSAFATVAVQGMREALCACQLHTSRQSGAAGCVTCVPVSACQHAWSLQVG